MISAKVPNPKKSASKSGRVHGLADYVIAPENTQHLEKCIAYGAENFLTKTHEGHKAEMIALSQEAIRSKDPVDHFVLSWKENEKPTPEQAKEAVEIFVKQCGLVGHQHFWGLHDDTENMHVHIAINRVHPNTYRVIEINKGFDREAQQQAIALIEHRQRWSREEHARYDIVDGKPVLSVHGQLAKQHGKSLSPGKREIDMELRTGEKSAKRHTIEEAGPIIRAAKSWQELHAGLAKIGMEYRRDGSGAKVFIGDVGIKASDVDRNGSIAKLEKRIGIFQAHNQEKPHDYISHTPQPYANQARTLSGHGMRRLSQCRMASTGGDKKTPGVLQLDARASGQQASGVRRTAGRSTGRSDPLTKDQQGWTRYTEDRKADKAARTERNASLKDKHTAERAALAARQKAHRADVFGGDWKGKGDVMNAMRSVIAAQQAAEKLEQREQHKAERTATQQSHPAYPSYEQYLKGHAPELADRWRYKDSPDKLPSRVIGDHVTPNHQRDIRDFEHRIVGRDVAYRVRGSGGFGSESFVDRGKHIDVIDSKSPAAVTAAMQLGAQKFGGKVTITGPDDYKLLCIQVAVKNGINIVNPELQPLIAAEKQHIEQQRTAEKQAAAERQAEAKRVQAQMKEPKPAQAVAVALPEPHQRKTARIPCL